MAEGPTPLGEISAVQHAGTALPLLAPPPASRWSCASMAGAAWPAMCWAGMLGGGRALTVAPPPRRRRLNGSRPRGEPSIGPTGRWHQLSVTWGRSNVMVPVDVCWCGVLASAHGRTAGCDGQGRGGGGGGCGMGQIGGEEACWVRRESASARRICRRRRNRGRERDTCTTRVGLHWQGLCRGHTSLLRGQLEGKVVLARDAPLPVDGVRRSVLGALGEALDEAAGGAAKV